MAVPLKLIQKLNVILVKIAIAYFWKLEKLVSKLKNKIVRNVLKITEKRKKGRELCFSSPTLKTYNN